MPQLRQILVYSPLIDSVWIQEFNTDKSAGVLRATVYADCLRDHCTNVTKLAIYYIEDGLPYEPHDTLGRRVLGCFALQAPRTLGILDTLSALPKICEDRVHLVIGLPDHYTHPTEIHSSQQLELKDGEDHADASEDENEDEDEENGSGETATSGSSASHLSTDTLPSDIDDDHDRDAIQVATNHPPVELFSASFARFIGAFKQPYSPTDASRTCIAQFVADVLHPTTSDRAAREENLLSRLVQLVDPKTEGVFVAAIARTAHYALLSCEGKERVDSSPMPVPLVVLSVKPDADSTTRRPSVDDAFRTAMRKFDADWTGSGTRNRNDVWQASCRPVFGITLVGSCLRVYGSIHSGGRWVSHHLMDPCDISPSSAVDALASIFQALHLGLIHLKDWYHHEPYTRALDPDDTLLPSPSGFLDPSGRRIRFRCSAPILQNPYVWHGNPSSTDWPNHRRDSFVIKFARSYSEDAHSLLAQANYAPKLIYCGPPYAAYPELAVYQPITMIIMIWCGNHTLAWGPAAPATAERVRAAVKLLHDNGMVHGDLRGQNVVVERYRGGAVRIIDFDWAGKEGEARYPKDLSPAVMWPPGAKAGGLITKAHDWYFVDNNFPLG